MGRKEHIAPNSTKTKIASIFLLIVLVLVALMFQKFQPKFLTMNNIMNLLGTSSIIGILALGNMLLMAAGEMSFAIGAQCTLIGAVFGRFLFSPESNDMVLAFLISVAVSVAVGLFFAFCTVKIGIPTFVCTLAVAMMVDGCSQLINSGTTLYSPDWPDNFQIMNFRIGGSMPVAFVTFIVLAIIVHILYEKTAFGRHLFSVGSNPMAADNCGINVPRIRVIAFILSSVVCGFGGVVAASYNNSVSLTMGSELMLPAIAATMLSAVFLSIGKYNVPGVVISSILMTVIQNGVIAAGYPVYVKDIVQGILLTIAVSIIAIIREDGLPAVKLET